jgi:hypothetical protein
MADGKSKSPIKSGEFLVLSRADGATVMLRMDRRDVAGWRATVLCVVKDVGCRNTEVNASVLLAVKDDTSSASRDDENCIVKDWIYTIRIEVYVLPFLFVMMADHGVSRKR